MSVVIAGVDLSTTPDEDTVVVLERRGDRWHTVHPEPYPRADLPVPPIPAPVRHRWTEETLTRTAEGWMRMSEFSGGEFVLDDEQRERITAAYTRLIREGKLATTAPLSVDGDRPAR